MTLVSARALLIPAIRRTLRPIVYNEYSKFDVSAKLFLPKIPTRLFGEEKKYDGEKPYCGIGTIGHVDHGKSTLTAAILKILSEKTLATSKGYNEIDKASQVNLNGIKVKVARVEYDTVNRHYGHTDCPENSDYIKIMITGTAQMDGAILVVAATEGVMSQTREHLLLSKKIGIEHIVVFINKIDDADSKVAKLVEMEIRQLLSEVGYNSDKVPVVKGSALCALEGKNHDIGSRAIIKLLNEVDSFIPTPVRDLDKPFLMPVEGAYSISGRETVVIGTIERGIIKKGTECEFVGINKSFKSVITGFDIFPINTTLTEAHAGDQVGVLIDGAKQDEVRGMIMSKPGSTKAHDNIEAQIYILKAEEGGRKRPVSNFIQLQMFSKTWDCPVQVTIPEKNLAMPGEDVTMQLKMFRRMPLDKGQRFTLHDGSITLGTGVVSNILKNLNEQQRLNLKEGKKNDEKKGQESDFWKKCLSEFHRSKKFWFEVLVSIVTLTFSWSYFKMAVFQYENKVPKEIEQIDLLNTKLRGEMNEEDEKKIKAKLIIVLDMLIIFMKRYLDKPIDDK